MIIYSIFETGFHLITYWRPQKWQSIIPTERDMVPSLEDLVTRHFCHDFNTLILYYMSQMRCIGSSKIFISLTVSLQKFNFSYCKILYSIDSTILSNHFVKLSKHFNKCQSNAVCYASNVKSATNWICD